MALGDYLHILNPDQRNSAQICAEAGSRFAVQFFPAKVEIAKFSFNMSNDANCQNRYPSPNRSAPYRGGSAPFCVIQKVRFSGRTGGDCPCYVNKRVDVVHQTGDSVRTIKTGKVKSSCLINLGFSQSPLHSLSQVVSRVTESARSWVLALVVLPAKQSPAVIVQLVHSVAHLSAHSLTTSLVAKTFQLSLVDIRRRRGSSSSAFCV